MTAVAEHRRLRLDLDCTVRDVRVTDLPALEWFGTYAHFRRLEESNYRDVEAGYKLWLVAEVNRFPAGHLKINLRVEDPLRGTPRGYIFAVRVFEPFQGLGLGTALVRAAENALRARGFRYVSIAVGKDNPRARRLYERLGYSIYREEVGHWQYVDLGGRVHRMDEPEFLMDKPL